MGEQLKKSLLFEYARKIWDFTVAKESIEAL